VKLKDLFVFLEKAQYEVCLIRIKEQVGEKRSAICTHRYADCPPNIPNMLSIKNSSMLMISVSENFLVESEWVFFYQTRSVPKNVKTCNSTTLNDNNSIKCVKNEEELRFIPMNLR